REGEHDSSLLNLLVLKTPHVGRMREFYQAIGIEFTEEQHGNGPVHYAGKVGDVVIEIYPLPAGSMPDATTRLGFGVASLAAVLEAVRNTGAVVRDPDRPPVELYEAQPMPEA